MFRCTARLLAFFLLAPAASAQEAVKSPGSIQISFVPPPLEKATYSLGIFEAKGGKLVRHLQEIALEKDFTVGLNGLSTTWDGKGDDGKSVPPGRYAARGYAVGPLKVEGEDTQGNDWASDDEKLRIKQVAAILYVPNDGGLAILATLADGTGAVMRFSPKGELIWRKQAPGYEPRRRPYLTLDKDRIFFLPARGNKNQTTVVADAETYQIEDGQTRAEHPGGIVTHLDVPALPPLTADDTTLDAIPAAEAPASEEEVATLVREAAGLDRSNGRDRTAWIAAGAAGLVQTDQQRHVLRSLAVTVGDPLPRQVSASTTDERLYLLETRPGWQRVRGLVWTDTKEEGGRPVSTWQTFFERNIRTPNSATNSDQPTGAAEKVIEINLDENPLAPGKPQKVRLTAVLDVKGSCLATKDSLKLRRVSERTNLLNAYLAKGKPPTPIEFFQYDGAATDVFSIKGVHRMMEFDAGEFEMTATGEKPADKKTEEPPDL